MPRRRAVTLWSLLCTSAALAILASACGWGRRAAPADGSDDRVDVVRLFKDPASTPEFHLTDLDGRALSSADWRGKVVFVNFWATWCAPCRAEIPDLIALQNKYRDQIVIVGISEDELPVDQVKAFATQFKVNYPVAMTTPEVRKIFKGVAALPTTFVLDREGRIVQKHVGLLNAARTEAEARVLSGVDAEGITVEHVDDSDKVKLTAAAEAKTLPGLNLTKLTEPERKAALQELLTSDCTCGCGLTLAICRIDDPSCPVSLPLAQAVVDKHAARAAE